MLIQTEIGRSTNVAREIVEIAGVTAAENVSGPYDVIVRIQAETYDDLGRSVIPQIQGVHDITRTLTCPVVTH